MNNEFKLIMLVTTTNKSMELENEIQEMLSKDLDWIKILGEVFYHRIAGHFYIGMPKKFSSLIPNDVYKTLMLYSNAIAFEQKIMYKYVCDVITQLNKSNIKYAAIKGLAFLFDIYKVGTKRSNDFDILVKEEDLKKLDDCMRKLGFIQTYMPNGKMIEASKSEKLIQRLNYHDLVPYVRFVEDGGIKYKIEFDINFIFDTKDNNIDEEVYDHIIKIENNGFVTKTLDFEMHLMFLCIHFYREATNSLWSVGKNDIKLYKIIDIHNYIMKNEIIFKKFTWCETAIRLNLQKKCYFTFSVICDFYDNDEYKKCIKILKPDDLSFMNEIIIEGQNKVMHRNNKISDIILNN